jgi:hypothetical protein
MKINRAARKMLFMFALAFAMMSSVAIRADAPRHRVGAICNDKTTSKATGSGACSHHGGVSCWQYSDGTCTKP